MMKIVALAAKRLDGEVVRKLTPEEEALYREVYTTVDKWNKSFREAGI
jgi:DNA replication initiation complex subunit (GINS family)